MPLPPLLGEHSSECGSLRAQRTGILLGEAWGPFLMVAHWTSQQEANSYRKVRRLGMITVPDFANDPGVAGKLSLKNCPIFSTSTNLHDLSLDGCNAPLIGLLAST